MNSIATIISNRSNGHIHLYWTDPPAFASNGRCIGRCSIESKNEGGNIISSLHSVSMIFLWSISMCSTFILLEHISLKKWLISVSAPHISFGNKSWKANGMSVLHKHVVVMALYSIQSAVLYINQPWYVRCMSIRKTQTIKPFVD